MEVFAGLPLPHRPPHRPAARLPARDRRARQHADHGRSPTTAPAPRAARPAPRTRRSSSTTPRSRSRTAWPGSTSSAARPPSTTTRGAGPGPATRRSAAGSGRPTAAASSDPFLVHWPQGITARGEVRTQYAHIIDMVPTVLDALGIEPPATIRGVTQAPIHGVSFAHTFDDADAPTPAPHAVLRDVRPPRHLPRRLAGGLPVARARRSPRPASAVRHADHGRDAGRARRQRLGALPRRRGLRGEPRRRRRAPRQAHRADRPVVRRGRQVRRAADRRQRPGTADDRTPADHRGRGPATRSGPAPSRCRSPPRPRVLNRPHSITADTRTTPHSSSAQAPTSSPSWSRTSW